MRILLVEDHADTAKVLSRLLKREGYSVHTSGTVADAVAAATHQTFDLLISDLGLPDATGYQLMAQLSSLYNLKGIALSGYGMDSDIRESTSAGFSAHLTKPVDLSQLIATIEAIAPSR